MRPSWSETWLSISREVAKRATCPRASVGAVIVDKHNLMVSAGFNGAISKAEHCLDVGCSVLDNHCVRSIHSEQNALLQAARRGVSTEDCTIYCTHEPCLQCTKASIQAGIWRVIFETSYESAEVERELKAQLIRSSGLVWVHKER